MTATPEALTADGCVVASSAVSRQEEAKALADEVDSGWWSRNRELILRSIGEEA